MLVNETVLLPGFSLIGFIFGSYVLIKKYKNEFVGDKDTYDNRLVLAYDIMTTLFITIGIGLSLTFGSIYLSRNECQPLTCVQLMSEFKDKTIELTAANNDILTLEATLNDLRSRLEARLPNSGSE